MVRQAQTLRREDFQIAVICAVGCEYDAVTFIFDEIWDGAEIQLGNAPGDYNKYKIGRIANRNTVLLLLPGMGKVNAASAAANLRSSFNGIELAILTGICGGVPGVGTDTELLLGDVVISRSIVQYDLGRLYADKFATKDTIEDSLGRPHESVRSLTAVFATKSGRSILQHRTSQVLLDIQARTTQEGGVYQRPATYEDRLFEPGYLHRHHRSGHCGCSELGACDEAMQASCEELQCDSSYLMPRSRFGKRNPQDLERDHGAEPELRVIVGRLGTGDTVMKSGLDRDRIAREQDLVAFEMEGAGIWNQFPCIIVKAVCDYADSHKNKNYQNFAAARAASATKAILEAYPYTDKSKRSLARYAIISGSNRQTQSENWPDEREHDEHHRKLLGLLATDHEAHKNFNVKNVRGTCEWFLKDRKYHKWLQSAGSSIIWVSAGPGCGKSVLARALIDDGRLSACPENPTICYFFFKDGDERRINSYDALSAILHQLFTQQQTDSLICKADSAFKNYGDTLRSNFHQLWKILVDCASHFKSREIVCVLDALDECSAQGRREILQALDSVGKVYYSSLRLKFLITSRPYDDLEVSFDKIATAKSYIRFDGDDKSEEIHREIDLVIDHKVSEFGKDFREEHRQAISDRLKAMENRTYLWLHLTLSIIDEKRSAYRKPSSIQTLLSRLPSSVDDAYERILSRSQNQEQAKCLLSIILTATRPLSLEEVNYALTAQERNFRNFEAFEDDMWPSDGLKTTVKNLCGLFINVFEEKVSFIHQTAREFLTTKTEPPSTWKGSFDMNFAHGKMSISCIRVLSLHELAPIHWSAAEFHHLAPRFMRYAARNWILHYNSQDTLTRNQYAQAARELCRTAFGVAPVWARYSGGGYGGGDYRQHLWDCTDLTLASCFGLLKVVECIVKEDKIDVNSEGGFFGTPIKAAAAAGHCELVQALVRYDADCDTGGGFFQTALVAAVVGGHSEIAKYLIGIGNRFPVEFLISTARKEFYRYSMEDLIRDYGEGIKITKEVIKIAGTYPSSREDSVILLMQQLGHAFITTEDMLECAVANPVLGGKLTRLFLERNEDHSSVTSSVVESAALGACGMETLKLLLEKRGDEIEITQRTIINAAKNKKCGIEVMEFLMEKRKDEVKISRDVVMAAAQHGSVKTMEFVLDEYDGAFEVTAKLILAVAENDSNGDDIMTSLIKRYGDVVVLISLEIIMLTAGSAFFNDALVILLDDDEIMEAGTIVVSVHGRNEGQLDLLLQSSEAVVNIKQKVVAAAKGNPQLLLEILRAGWL
ncbi:Vegetative incompatibility protein HET-E-1 [Colletotrichum siamense]|uniref:Vegetative incompatibility protein HET-E-1 n=1 Tax=Colletotrichum siamense TaxID=690259 RepID=UPI0018721E16|nr:Vegetative incompatibility protein HET-E-1 [Colletotrichum siamense]KAF5494939.1 Vegetative incompatibility protein HET-E-1 [Colletotrichum siamense]